jgi:hypothetical protein
MEEVLFAQVQVMTPVRVLTMTQEQLGLVPEYLYELNTSLMATNFKHLRSEFSPIVITMINNFFLVTYFLIVHKNARIAIQRT